MGKNLRAIIIDVCIGALAFAAGTIVALWGVAGTGEMLGLAGALIGAAASVWGAFAVARHSALRERREAENLVTKLFEDLNDAMGFLDRLQRGQPVDEDVAEADERIDRILVTVPGMTRLLVEERLASRTGRARFMGASIRFVYAVERYVRIFEKAAEKRRRLKERDGDAHNLAFDVSPAAVEAVKRACETTLRQLETGGRGIAPAARRSGHAVPLG